MIEAKRARVAMTTLKNLLIPTVSAGYNTIFNSNGELYSPHAQFTLIILHDIRQKKSTAYTRTTL